MNYHPLLYSIGTVFVAAIAAGLISGWAQGAVAAAQKTADIVQPVEITAAAPNGLVRVILASPYGR
jgi:hypothetical protein